MICTLDDVKKLPYTCKSKNAINRETRSENPTKCCEYFHRMDIVRVIQVEEYVLHFLYLRKSLTATIKLERFLNVNTFTFLPSFLSGERNKRNKTIVNIKKLNHQYLLADKLSNEQY